MESIDILGLEQPEGPIGIFTGQTKPHIVEGKTHFKILAFPESTEGLTELERSYAQFCDKLKKVLERGTSNKVIIPNLEYSIITESIATK